MQHVKNAIEWNAMKMLKMHQNAKNSTIMRMGRINTTFGKKQHASRVLVVGHRQRAAGRQPVSHLFTVRGGFASQVGFNLATCELVVPEPFRHLALCFDEEVGLVGFELFEGAEDGILLLGLQVTYSDC